MIGGLGFGELILLGIVAVLLFGKRLPDVARSLGQSYHQFRRSLSEVQSEMSHVVDTTSSTLRDASREMLTYDDDFDEPTAPAFHPPPRQSEAGD
jgi:sec-independent protein translocase protein TatA